MTLQTKRQKLDEIFHSAGKALIAFSAGVDSTYLLKAAHDIMGGNVIAVTVSSPFFPAEELTDAEVFCKAENIRHIVMGHDPLASPEVAANPRNRCYLCKRIIFSKISALADEMGIVNVFDGSNLDDDPKDRPGMRALDELGIKSPLREAGLTKTDIRELSREMGLSTWDKPALACIATRIATGEILTREKLMMTEKAERFIRSLGFGQLRVRMNGNSARIEVPPEDIQRIAEAETARKINEYLKGLGYSHVSLDLGGYHG